MCVMLKTNRHRKVIFAPKQFLMPALHYLMISMYKYTKIRNNYFEKDKPTFMTTVATGPTWMQKVRVLSPW